MRYKFKPVIFVSLLLLAIIFLFHPPTAAHADIAPYYESPFGTNPKPEQETTQVRMVAEIVDMVVDAPTPSSEGLVRVTAVFTMSNLGQATEHMDVGFPLAQGSEFGDLCGQNMIKFKPITDLTAWVNGEQASTKKTYSELQFAPDSLPQRLPCWEYFPVSFPPAQNVIIRISYTGEPARNKRTLIAYAYAYVLETGAGWLGTIGRADITIHLPYELNGYNYLGCRPDPCTMLKDKVQWHLKDFEPDQSYNIHASFLPPPLWQRILIERANVEKNPNDGEAWGRLGKAYKEAIIEDRGFRNGPEAEEMYRWSEGAYQKAIALLPEDADWHYGYAELLCHHAEWDTSPDDLDIEAWQACVLQLKQTLDLQPDHAKANNLLQYISGFTIPLIDLSGPQPNYLILTPQPTTTNTRLPQKTSSLSPTLQPNSPTAILTATTTATPTVAASASRPVQSTPTMMPTATPTPAPAGESSALFYLGVVVVLIVLALILWALRRR